jgi:hypothetical protein
MPFGGRIDTKLHFGVKTPRKPHHHSIETTSNELLNPENTGVVVGISFLSHLQAEISVLPVLVAAILDFRLPVWLHSIETISVELLDPKNIGVAVRISFYLIYKLRS